jgi:hypothetical protein
MTMSSRIRALSVAAFASVILCVAQGSAGASGSAPSRGEPSRGLPTFKMKVSYSRSWIFKSHIVSRCVKLHAYGTIHYKVVLISPPRQLVEYEDIKLTSPTISAKVYHYSRGRCTSRAQLTKIKLGQFWTGFACSFNPSLSVSAPWGVSFGGWPSCGKRNKAGFTTVYGKIKADRTYVQGNSGSPTVFGNDTKSQADSPPCYGVISTTTAYVGGHSDSFGASNGTSSRKVCLKKHQ